MPAVFITGTLNARLREIVADGGSKIELQNVHGQRYIGTDLNKPVEIEIFGTPGNDLGAFMNGPRIIVHGNAQDGCGNTMNEGEIIVHGRAGDTVGLSARGGKIFIREDVGYRAGIHMKEYKGKEAGHRHRRDGPGLPRRVHGRRRSYSAGHESR